MKTILIQTPSDHDSDDIRWVDDAGKEHGFGFVAKGEKKIAVIRCPECERENYALAVLDGVCVWCGFKAGNL